MTFVSHVPGTCRGHVCRSVLHVFSRTPLKGARHVGTCGSVTSHIQWGVARAGHVLGEAPRRRPQSSARDTRRPTWPHSPRRRRGIPIPPYSYSVWGLEAGGGHFTTAASSLKFLNT